MNVEFIQEDTITFTIKEKDGEGKYEEDAYYLFLTLNDVMRSQESTAERIKAAASYLTEKCGFTISMRSAAQILKALKETIEPLKKSTEDSAS